MKSIKLDKRVPAQAATVGAVIRDELTRAMVDTSGTDRGRIFWFVMTAAGKWQSTGR